MLDALVIGAGPAGLMAAEELVRAGRRVVVCEAKASPARKFLMAGKSGLNVTRDQTLPEFMRPFSGDGLAPMLAEFGPDQVRLVVDRVYEQRQWEYQGYRFRRESAKWKIYAIDPAEVHDPPVPYGTPAFPTQDESSESGNSESTGR